MKAGAGKRKGSSFERATCKALSLWISGGERDDLLWRSAMSGGRATVGLKSGQIRTAQAGDITAIDSLGERLLDHVVIECKSYRDIQLFSGIANDQGKLRFWWDDLRRHAAAFGKAPMLVVRQNSMPTLCLLPPSTAVSFGLDFRWASVYLPRWECYVFLFEHCFLKEAKLPEYEKADSPTPALRWGRQLMMSRGLK